MLEYVNMKKYKYFLIFALVVILLPLASTVFALELTYPNIPGFGALGQRATLPQFIGYFFTFAFTTVGIIGVLIIAISGVKILISAGNPTAISDARERIWNAVLGIILLMFSVVLLREVNPNLINPRTSVLPVTNGLYFLGHVNCAGDANCQANYPNLREYKPAPTNEPDIDAHMPTPDRASMFSKLSYKCNGGPNLLVWAYDNPNYVVNNFEANAQPNLTTYSLQCSQNEVVCDGSNSGSCNTIFLADAGIKSYKTDIEKPGVYFYLNPDCSGLSSNVLQDSGDIPNFGSEFIGGEPPVLGIRIVNTDLRNRYGTVLTQHYQFDGECSAPIIRSDTGSGCYPIPNDSNGNVFNPFSAYVIKQAQWVPENSTVALYSANLGLELNLSDIGDPPDIGYQYSVYNGYIEDYGYNGTPGDLLQDQGGNDIEQVDGGEWRSWKDVPQDPANPTTAPPECREDPFGGEFGEPQGNYTCLNYIQNTGSFNIFLYGEQTDIENNPIKSCKLLPNGLIADYWPTANESFKNFLSKGNTLYRMDIIPRPY